MERQILGVHHSRVDLSVSAIRDHPILQSLACCSNIKGSRLRYPPNSYLALIVAMAVCTSSEYGKRLIPQILDSLASAEPDRIVYSIATFSNNCLEFRRISARALAKAVDKTAWWIHNHVRKHDGHLNGEQNVDPNGEQQENLRIQPLGYIGPRKSGISRQIRRSKY